MDLFYFFFHKAIEIGNSNAEINLITTNYYVTAHGGKKLRTAIKEDTKIRKLINFNELKIFESALGQHNLITMLTKKRETNEDVDVIYTNKKGFANENILQSILSLKDQDTKYYRSPLDKLFDGKENYIRFIPNATDEDNIINNVLAKVIQSGFPLKEFCNVNNGLRSGMDKYVDEEGVKHGLFILESDEVENIYKSTSLVEETVKPYYKNSNISKYITSDNTHLSVIYSTKKTDTNLFPLTFNYLSKYKEVINNKRWKESVPWFSLVRPRNESIFISPKIVCPQRSYSNTFGYNESEWYAGSDVFFITLKKSQSINLKYILALLNSKLYYLWLFHKGKRKGNILELIGTPINEVYIKPLNLNDQKSFIKLVDKLMVLLNDQSRNKNNSNKEEIYKIQEELDQLVFNLYGLTNNEINYVNNFKMNKEGE